MTDIRFIDSHDALKALCNDLDGSPWLTLDTEFLREKTYFPQLCLVQIANHQHVACVDPLSIDDLSPLFELLKAPDIIKIVHSGFQDLDIFYRLMGEVPTPIFDTQIAASLLGLGDQVGYGKLVEQVCKVQLDKSQSRTDWSRRPLSDKQVDYAADDVRYLRDIYQYLTQRLDELGRSTWLSRDFEALSDPAQYENPPETMWKKVKQHGRLKGVQLAVLQALAAWRETQALKKDKPRRWIASDDLLLDLSKTLPKNVDEMSSLRSADAGFVRHKGEFILKLIHQAKQTPKEQWPTLKTYQAITPQQDALVDYLMSAAKLKAAEHEITLSNLTSRKELEKFIQGDQSVAVMQSWRHTLLGQYLAQLMQGELTLVPSDQGLLIHNTAMH